MQSDRLDMSKKNDITLLRVNYLRGPNIWTYRQVLEVWLDLGELGRLAFAQAPGLQRAPDSDAAGPGRAPLWRRRARWFPPAAGRGHLGWAHPGTRDHRAAEPVGHAHGFRSDPQHLAAWGVSRHQRAALLQRAHPRPPPEAVRAVATNTLRVAKNAPHFLVQAEAALGFRSRRQEARPLSCQFRLIHDMGCNQDTYPSLLELMKFFPNLTAAAGSIPTVSSPSEKLRITEQSDS